MFTFDTCREKRHGSCSTDERSFDKHTGPRACLWEYLMLFEALLN